MNKAELERLKFVAKDHLKLVRRILTNVRVEKNHAILTLCIDATKEDILMLATIKKAIQ